MPTGSRTPSVPPPGACDRLDAIVRAVADGVIALNRDGRITLINEPASKLMDIPIAAAHGQLLDEVCDAAGPAWHLLRRAVPAALDEGGPFRAEDMRIPRTGRQSDLVLSVVITPMREATGIDGVAIIGGAVIVMRDASSLPRTNEALRRACQAAEAAAQAKALFLASMSHEIRTPMNGVIGMTSILRESPLSDEQRHQMNVIHDSAVHLLRIVDDLLDYSRLESGKVTIEAIRFAPRLVIDQALAVVEPTAARKALTLGCVIDAAVPATVHGDPGRLRQILINLLDNAVKFTPHGGVTLRVEAPQRASRRMLLFEVEDTGIGLPDVALARLFEAFEQADASIARRFRGTGLGLAICRQLVELMGGHLGVRRLQAGGSLFWFELPLVIEEPSEASASVSASAFASMSTPANEPARERVVPPLRVLVVDDSVVNQRVALAILRNDGHDVFLAHDGAAALALLETQPVDLILMDCELPMLSGYDTTRALRARGHGMPVIAVTANATSEERARSREAGMDDFLAKPFTARDLREALTRNQRDAS